MTIYRFGVRLHTQLGLAFEPAALGADGTAPNRFTDKDINKAVKLGPNNNYILCADGNDIEGVVATVEPNSVNNGYSFGTVQRRFKESEAIVTGAALAVGAAVVAAAQSALGTAQAAPHVKAGAGVLFLWRVKSLLKGTGQVGQTILIEPISCS